MIVLGIDPDLRTLGMAWCSETAILRVKIVRAEGGADSRIDMLRELEHAAIEVGPAWPDLVVVEGQDVYLGQTKNPRDIVHLAQVAGMAAGVFYARLDVDRVIMPRPSEWKGNVPKKIHQARVLDRYGIPYEVMSDFARPTDFARIAGGAEIKPGEWKHVVDAIGLARWGAVGCRSTAQETR